jgi:hypothetical protein
MVLKILYFSVILLVIIPSAFADNLSENIIRVSGDSIDYNIKAKDDSLNLKKDEVKNKSEVLKEKTNHSPASDTLVTVYLKDGNDVTGFIMSQDSISIVLKTKSKIVMTLPKNQIVKISRPKIDYINGDYFEQDANDARLFLAPTARPIRPNSLLISDVEVFFPMVGFGIANIFSVMGGVSLLPYTKEQLVYINAKVTPLHIKYLDVSAGFIYMNFTSNAEGLKIGYSGATIGTNRYSFSTGIGIAFEKNSSQSPLFIIGGDVLITSGNKFILENWIFTYKEAPVITFFGARTFGPNFSGDFGLIKIWDKYTSNSGWPFFPYASVTLNIDLISGK